MIIGIPDLPLFERHHPAFSAFFRALGAQVRHLPASLDPRESGTRLAHQESCLPMKLACGRAHLLWKTGVDALFIPRFVRGSRGWCCPRSIGLPDTLRASLNLAAHQVLSVELEPDRPLSRLALLRLAWNLRPAMYRLRPALRAYQEHFAPAPSPEPVPVDDQITIGLLGHPYALDDPFASMDLLEELEHRNLHVWRRTALPDGQRAGDVFWHMGGEIILAAEAMIANGRVQGLIYLSPFPCGPDSVLISRVEAIARRERLPFLLLPVDEHNGKAAFVTRLEAFSDLLNRKGRSLQRDVDHDVKTTPVQPISQPRNLGLV